MSLEIKGAILNIGKTEKVSEKFSKRQLVIQTEGEYPQTVALEFTQARTSKLDGLAEGQVVTVAFNIKGSEWKGKYFTTLEGWMVKAEEGSGSNQKAAPNLDDSDSLPF